MNDEIETRRAAKLRALKSGCCMWSPILPPAQGSDTGQEATSKAAANTAVDRARHAVQAEPETLTAD
jgi:hypothetical protein